MQSYVASLDYEDIKDIQILNEVLISLAQKVCRSASLVADSEKILADAKRAAYLNYMVSSKAQGYNWAPSLVKDFVQAQFSEELRCALYAERSNRGLTHSMQAIISILSATKAELQTLHFQT